MKPWFAGKTEYSPPVRDLARQGFRLAGGRLDYVNNQHVAVLVYEHNKQVINLFICPASGKLPSDESTLTQDGYHLVRSQAADGNGLERNCRAPGSGAEDLFAEQTRCVTHAPYRERLPLAQRVFVAYVKG